ncbi:MAG: hydrogenase maturation protease [Actinomycetota bacterium]|nr:hydrogenase maturation protease [Actinomycetota bacterium]
MSARPGSVVVAGIGSEYRHDDGVGIAVARVLSSGPRAVADLGPLGEPLDLLGRWDGAALAVVVDALRGEEPAGTVHVADLRGSLRRPDGGAAPARRSPASSHGLGVQDVLRIAQAVGSAPLRVVLVGVVGERFDEGVGLSDAVRPAVESAASAVRALVAGCC